MTGALASVVSQTVGVVAGVQNNIDWKGVGMAAVGGAIGAGMPNISNAWVTGAASSMLAQGIGVMTGMQEKFSWAAVAGAAVGAGVSNALQTGQFGTALQRIAGEGIFPKFIRSGLAGLASGITTGLLEPGKLDWKQVGLGAFDSALRGAFTLDPDAIEAGKEAAWASSGARETNTTETGTFKVDRAPWQSAPAAAAAGTNLIPYREGGSGSTIPYEDGGIGYLASLFPREGRSVSETVGEYRDPSVPQVLVPGNKWSDAQKLAYDRSQLNYRWNPFSMVATGGKYLVGGVELVAGGLWNGGGRIVGGVVSLAALGHSVDRAVALQQSVTDALSYRYRSSGAKDIGEALKPVGQKLGEWHANARAYSEIKIGDGATTALSATAQAAVEILATVTGLRTVGNILRLEGSAAAGSAAAGARLTHVLEGVKPIAPGATRALLASETQIAVRQSTVGAGRVVHQDASISAAMSGDSIASVRGVPVIVDSAETLTVQQVVGAQGKTETTASIINPQSIKLSEVRTMRDMGITKVGRRAVHEGYDLALGLTNNGLFPFAQSHNAKMYHVRMAGDANMFDNTWPGSFEKLAEGLQFLMDRSRAIKVNLTGVVDSIDELPAIIERGKGGIDDKPLWKGRKIGNVTNWEISQIFGNPERATKAMFYIDGKQVEIGDF